MSSHALTEHMVDRIAQELVPGCRARLTYRIASDNFRIYATKGEEFTDFLVERSDLTKSIDDFSDLVKSKLPPEWLSVPA